MDQCLAIARRSHPALQAAALAVDAQAAGVAQARAAYYPQAALSATAGRSQTRDLIGGGVATTDSASPLTATGEMIVYDFGRTGGRVALSRTTLDAARESLGLRLDQVVLEVEESYFEVLRADAAAYISGTSLQARKSFVPVIARAYERGSRSKFDLSRAETDLESARLAQITAEARLEAARKRLLTAMGTPNAPWKALTDRLETAASEPDETDLVALALRRRPEVRAARLEVEAAAERRRVAFDQHLPSVGVNGGYALSRQFSSPQARANTWQVGVTASLDLFTGFAAQAGVEAAAKRQEQAERTLAEVSQGVVLEVRSALIALREAQARIEAARRLSKSAESSFGLALRQFERGSGGIFDLIDAQNQALRGRLDYNDSLADYRVARARLERAAGGPWVEP